MQRITVAKGDGIGPEIMDATLKIILAAGAKLEIDEIEVGEKVYLAGNTAGIAKESWDIIRKNKIFLNFSFINQKYLKEVVNHIRVEIHKIYK